MDLGLEGRVALVTGASKGIGRAIAAELVREGAKVAISSRSAERIEETAREIGATGFVLDSADLDAAGPLLEQAGERLRGPGGGGVHENRGRASGSAPGARCSSRTPAGRRAASRCRSRASSGRRRTATSCWRRWR